MTDRYCIIGAGPSGLAAAKELKQLGIPYDHFERHSNTGGIWDLDNPYTPMYESAHFISSKTMSAFPGFDIPEDYPDYPSRQQILEYIRSYAREYDLESAIQFNATVENVVPHHEENGGPTATVVVNGEPHTYRGVICSTGMNWDPIIPNFKGNFTGEMHHMQTYTSEEEFRGKRVLIVGLGNSGADIACDAARAAKRAYVSVRRGYHFIPKHVLGKPADVFAHEGPQVPLWLETRFFGFLLKILVGNTECLGMPRPDHKVLESHPLMNDQMLHYLRHGDVELVGDIERFEGSDVVLRDGTRLEGIDLVLLATGFQRKVSYLDPSHLDDGNHPASNFLTCFSRKYDNIFLLGFCELNGALYPHAGRLAALIANYAKAVNTDPAAATKFRKLIQTKKLDLTGGRKLIDSERHLYYCDNHALEKVTRCIFKQMKWVCP